MPGIITIVISDFTLVWKFSNFTKSGIFMQYKLAEKISDFAGSMVFVYLHTIWFLAWFVLKLNIDVLTLIVSLEAIYLSTFIMINQNRQEETTEKLVAEVEEQDEVEEDIDDIQEDIDEIQEDVDDIQKQFAQVHQEIAEIKQLLNKTTKK